MIITLHLFLLLLALAFICELIDSSLGMGYGTILSPVLLIMGFDPLVSVPAILLSQAVGGLAASYFHHRYSNVSFRPDSSDLRIVLIISGFGIVATICAALLAIHLPKMWVKTYIGALVFAMGIIILLNRKFRFSWQKMIGIGLLSAFNKGISGGGFGPIVTAGQILSGQQHKEAIGTTTLAEAPICIAGVLAYIAGRSAGPAHLFPWGLNLALLLGVLLVAPIGPLLTRKLDIKHLHWILGVLVIALGALTLCDAIFKPFRFSVGS